MMIYLVCYDLSDDRIRKKISDQLLRLGLVRLQYSVFAGQLSDRLVEVLKAKANALIDSSKNSKKTQKMFILKVSINQLENIYLIGDQNYDLKEITGQKNTLFFE